MQISPEKIPYLQEIAYFSLDLSHQVYDRIHKKDGKHIQEICKVIVKESDFSGSGQILREAIKRLPEGEQNFIIQWINTSFFAEGVLGRSWGIFENATDREWVRRYGFASVDECVELLGTKMYAAINELAHEMGHQFLVIDQLCTQLEEKPLSEWDLLVVGRYNMQSGGWDLTNTASEYCLSEIFRQHLKKISFSEPHVEIINEKIDVYVHSIHPNKPTIDIRDVLE